MVPVVLHEKEKAHNVSFYFVWWSAFICNILSMGCISSVLMSKKIDPCFPGIMSAMRTQHCVILRSSVDQG